MTFTPETARAVGQAGGQRSGQRRRKLVLSDVEQQLGALDTPEDAQRWLRQAFLWAAAEKVSGSRALAMVGAIREWGKLHEAEATFDAIEALRATVHRLEAERDRLAQELEQARLAGARS